MQKSPTCAALLHPTSHCPHRRIFQVVFGNCDGGELGGYWEVFLKLQFVANSAKKEALRNNPSLKGPGAHVPVFFTHTHTKEGPGLGRVVA